MVSVCHVINLVKYVKDLYQLSASYVFQQDILMIQLPLFVLLVLIINMQIKPPEIVLIVIQLAKHALALIMITALPVIQIIHI